MILQDEVHLLHNCRSISSKQAKKTYVLRNQIVQPEIVGSCGKSTPGYTLIDNTLMIHMSVRHIFVYILKQQECARVAYQQSV